MATYTNTKDVIGEQATLDGLIERSLTEFTDTDVLELGNYAFYSNNTIKSITLPNLTKIGHSSFINCSALSDIHIGLEKSTMCTLASTSALNDTGRSIIFVPPNLVNTYKSGTNWSTYADRIYAEGDPDAPVWDDSEITDTEAQIAERVNNGTAASYYKVGQYKNITIETLGTFCMQIIAKNVDELSDGSGYAQLTWFPKTLPYITHEMNTTDTAVGGWGESDMRRYLNEDIWPLIPLQWRNIIKEVKKYSRISTEENNVITSDKIWLLGLREIAKGTTAETLGPRYSIAFVNDAHKIRNNQYWWLRTVGQWNGERFGDVEPSGKSNISSFWPAYKEYGVVFGFCT